MEEKTVKNSKFIYCIDEKLAHELKKHFLLIRVQEQSDKNVYIFENKVSANNSFNFSNIDKSKYLFSDKLTF